MQQKLLVREYVLGFRIWGLGFSDMYYPNNKNQMEHILETGFIRIRVSTNRESLLWFLIIRIQAK